MASLAKSFGFSANPNSSLSSVSHMQDKGGAVFSSQSSSSALPRHPGQDPVRTTLVTALGRAGLAHRGSWSRRTKPKGREQKREVWLLFWGPYLVPVLLLQLQAEVGRQILLQEPQAVIPGLSQLDKPGGWKG